MSAALERCCTLDYCEAQLGAASVRTRLRVGTTLGLRDEPLSAVLALRRFDQMPGAVVEWVQLPKDLPAVTAMLNVGLLDLAAMYSEDAIGQLSCNASLRVCGMFSGLPRRWCLLVPRGCAEDDFDWGSSRIGVGEGLSARLMCTVARERLGCSGEQQQPLLVEFESLNFALRALRRQKDIHAALWEITVLEMSALKEWCDVKHEFSVPWPSHLFLASKEIMFSKLCTVRYFVCFCNLLCREFHDQTLGSCNEALHYLFSAHSLSQEEVKEWLRSADSAFPWSCSNDVEESAFRGPLELLTRLGLLPGHSRVSPGKFLAYGVSLKPGRTQLAQAPQRGRSGSETIVDSAEDADVGSCQEGMAWIPPGSRHHKLLGRLPELCRDPELGEPCPAPPPTAAQREKGAAGALRMEAFTEPGAQKGGRLPVPAG